MNNKGFMMAEVVVVASIVLVALVGLYASYNKVFSIYNKRVDYYDVATLYELGNIREIYKDDFESIGSTGSVLVDEGSNYPKRLVYYVHIDELNDLISNNINLTFKDYLEFLSTSLKIETENLLVMERCITDDNCKYAYLEVFDDEETS